MHVYYSYAELGADYGVDIWLMSEASITYYCYALHVEFLVMSGVGDLVPIIIR